MFFLLEAYFSKFSVATFYHNSMCNIHSSAYIIVIKLLILKIFDGQIVWKAVVFCSLTAGTQLHALLCLVNFLEASQCVLVSCHICKRWALKGLPDITTVLRQGNGGKFSSEAAAATSSHCVVGKTGAGSPWADFPARGSEHTAPHPASEGQTQTVLWQISLVSCLWCSVMW